ncbi:MAG: GNAT family N-acetyltransferase [Burkholderiaceae bacterium]
MPSIRIHRLQTQDIALARELFTLMARVFEEECAPLSDAYLHTLLQRQDFWALAAFADELLAGGLTAHVLPMSRSPSRELFLYDIAVRADLQRHGIGARLVAVLREQGAQAGIATVFVAADEEDTHALDFYRALGGQESVVRHYTFSDED